MSHPALSGGYAPVSVWHTVRTLDAGMAGCAFTSYKLYWPLETSKEATAFASHFMMRGENTLLIQLVPGHITMAMKDAHFAADPPDAVVALNPFNNREEVTSMDW